MLRSHNCGELNKNDISKEVFLCGWVESRRDHGDIIFIDIRDKYGITQLVFDPTKDKQIHQKAHNLRNEYCIRVSGKVSLRPEGTINPKINTGEIEIYVEKIEVLSESETPPFEIKEDINVSEEIRLKYRYLDLRRNKMQKRLSIRHNIYKFIMDFLDNEKFTYVETPILTKSTPEGARDFLVPCRIQEGRFFALPQSPQIFKQLLMVSGLDRYFQIAKCFRDEDLRADRQPEFTQLDMEMSFVTQEDILDLCERLFKELFSVVFDIKNIQIPFQKIDYNEAINKYGSDKPDTRFDLFLNDLTDIVKKGCDFKVFQDAIDSNGKIMGLVAPGYSDISRKEIDNLTNFVKEFGAKGLAFFKITDQGLVSPITKFFSEDMLSMFKEKTNAQIGDMIFILADKKEIVCEALGALRLKIGNDKNLIDKNKFNFNWVINFPLFKFNNEENRWVSEHHPFTYFREEDNKYFETNELLKIRSLSYDLVLNGNEIGSGSIRIHRKDVQEKIFNVLGLSEEECNKKFGFLLQAFKYGVPPHGGIAFGIDRIISIFTKDLSIRELIAFPKTQKATCPLSEAPSDVDNKQLDDLNIKVKKYNSL